MTLRVEAVEIVGLRTPCCGTVLERHGWTVLLLFRGGSASFTPGGRRVLCHNCGKTRNIPKIYSSAEAATRDGNTAAGRLQSEDFSPSPDELVLSWHKENLLLRLPEPTTFSR